MNPLVRKNEELKAILQVSQVLTSSLDLEKNLHSAMEILASRLGMQRGCVFLLDPLSRELQIVAAYGLNRKEIQRGKYRIGEGIVGRVIQTGQPMFIPNIGEEPMFLNKTDSRPQKSGISFLCMPISLEGKTLGVISVDGIYTAKEGNVDDDLRVLSIVASFIAQFVMLWTHLRKAESECGYLRMQLKEKFSLPNIVGESAPFQHVLKLVRRVAATDTTVLLMGESGTGKELIAQTLHYQSRRSKQPFVAVNLAALPENLIEAELFGVEKGAYTGATVRRVGRFEAADQGTIFLDEIGELPLNLQVKLLRVLQERSFERIGSSEMLAVDVRVVTATNRNLMEAVAKGSFREDLYWRLNVVPIVLPPLRERGEDIPLLLNFYLDKFNRQYNRWVQLSPMAMSHLKAYDWPGNIRELANTIERLVIMSEKEMITENELPANILHRKNTDSFQRDDPFTETEDLGSQMQQMERRRILQALKEAGCVQQRAARILGITPRQLGYRIQKYGIRLKSPDHLV
jgi:Nif-specific regulatory protein